MKIAHIYPKYASNSGDHFVQIGIRKLLKDQVGGFEYVGISNIVGDSPNLREPVGITKRSVDGINSCDLLVIGGSNLYEVAANRWGVEIDDEALDALAVPVVLMGIGSGWSFAYPKFPLLPDRVADQIRRLHSKARGSSVRDDLTARVLASGGIGPCTVTGCPATFLGEESLREVGGGIVGVPFLPRRMYAAPALLPSKRGNPTYVRRRMATKSFLGLVDALRGEGFGTRILVHDAYDVPLAKRLVGDYVYEPDPLRMLDAIRACDVIVGFRLHAGIAALGFGIPAIPILLDGRNYGFAETFGLLELAVPLDPASVSLVMERVRLALGPNRRLWNPVIERRNELGSTMRRFLASAF